MAKENVGGIESPFLSNFPVHGSIRGSHQYNFNGMDMSDMHSGIGLGYFNTDSFEEMQFSTSGISAEHSRGGLVMNTVTKSGGNRFSGQVAFYYESTTCSRHNIDDDLRARGVGSGAPLDYLYDVSGDFGGPIKRDESGSSARPPLRGHADRAQLHAAGRQHLRRRRAPAERHRQGDDAAQSVEPVHGDLRPRRDQPAQPSGQPVRHARCRVQRALPLRRVAGQVRPHHQPDAAAAGGVGRGSPPFTLGYHETHREGVSTAFDEITRVRFDAATQDFVQQGDILVFNANLTYFKDKFLGGAHDVKFGAEHRRGKLFQRHLRAGDVERRYQNGASYRVIAYNTPVEQVARNYSVAGYVQDSMRSGQHLTLNLGLRTEWWRGDVPEQSNQPTAFAEIFGGARTYPEQIGVMEWTTFSPRLGVAYDVTRRQPDGGEGDLRPLLLPGPQLATSTPTRTRTRWPRRPTTGPIENRNNVPDFPSEFGTLRSLNLPRLRRIDPDMESPYTDEVSGSVELGLTPRSSFSARYT